MATGIIYGVVLNDVEEREALAAQFDEAPYAAPPQATVVYIKPQACLTERNAAVPLPDGAETLQASATIALTFARDAVRIDASEALAAVGYARIALDICLPHASYFRPAIAERCRDGFLPMAIAAAVPGDLEQTEIVTEIDGAEAHRWPLSRLARPIATLIAELSGFMTLRAGDTLLIGLPGDAPTVREGQSIRVTAGRLPALATRVKREALE